MGYLFNTVRVITKALGHCNNIYVCSGNSVVVKIHTAKKWANEVLGVSNITQHRIKPCGAFPKHQFKNICF